MENVPRMVERSNSNFARPMQEIELWRNQPNDPCNEEAATSQSSWCIVRFINSGQKCITLYFALLKNHIRKNHE